MNYQFEIDMLKRSFERSSHHLKPYFEHGNKVCKSKQPKPPKK